MPDAARWDAVRLDGAGFVLRRWRADDLDVLLRHADDPAVVRGLSHRFPTPYTRADGEAFLAGRVVDFNDPVFAIEVDGAACGGIGARPGVGERAHSAELGYWLGQAHWGRGLMTRAVGLYTAWVFDALRLHRLQATVLDFNTGSARVLDKNGFLDEGRMRHAVIKDGRLFDLRLFARTRALD
ncbi:GNAT family N-acetyltransferase [Luteimonas terrae]|uniref:RimJ/RimL family protein N-acetyltransferase n=1 Tax=Luteimonas terrae TaxID=1530191 RepID=A0ABU1XSF6_9GAMM|nr:GNAT family protein [Luteimonas terrae]MDR7191689.1 RimJ/RimL family protein N-acetyltransferase [Luteimonas terrae]